MSRTSNLTPPHIAFVACVMLIGALFFSYYPLLQLGTLSGFYVDIALLYIIATLTVLGNAISIYRYRFVLWQSWSWRLLLLFTVYATLSCLWSTNALRGLVTAAFMWLIAGIVSTIIIHTPGILHQSKRITAVLSLGLIVSIFWAIWQLIGDALGATPTFTLLPLAYSSEVFGIARPTAFALEPQFFASLLLAPLSWFLVQTLRKPSSMNVAYLILTATLLVLTLSRGGIFAACIALIIIFLTTQVPIRQRLQAVGPLSIAVLLPFAAIFSIASLNQRDSISGYSALRGSVSHLSLGTIVLPAEPSQSPRLSTKPASVQSSTTAEPGYVRDSTTSRLSMSDRATKLWLSTPQTILFGVGIGGFGASAHANNPSLSVGSIVNNNYLEILAETGLIGMAFFVSFFGSIIVALWRAKYYALIAVVVAFLVQWCFFSGNANILHAWAFTGFAIGILQNTRKPQAT